ncbi:hypothetical protein C8F04DRAFT_1272681 [Mycena alexandri]|uniref:Uncharacterized protein n=1 Tax=Mycena alexandri TaxID=1745969 RepID=A0AAD6WRH1_9AGAR|nr:hypothetical protein C8F04DRAFT_1272681 [Mycena alexandri]
MLAAPVPPSPHSPCSSSSLTPRPSWDCFSGLQFKRYALPFAESTKFARKATTSSSQARIFSSGTHTLKAYELPEGEYCSSELTDGVCVPVAVVTAPPSPRTRGVTPTEDPSLSAVLYPSTLILPSLSVAFLLSFIASASTLV